MDDPEFPGAKLTPARRARATVSNPLGAPAAMSKDMQDKLRQLDLEAASAGPLPIRTTREKPGDFARSTPVANQD